MKIPFWDNIKYVIFEKIDENQRKKLGFFLVLVFILGIIYAIYALNSMLGTIDKQVLKKENILKEIGEMQNDYQELKKKFNKTSKMLSNPTDSISTFLDKEATILGIQIDTITPKSTSPLDDFKENKWEVSIRKITLAELVDYFYKIETHTLLLKIGKVTIKPRYESPLHLRVNFDVSSFEKKEE
ncbi:MAG: hypothetical protein ABIA04_08245 [Pseudomonadota bacterium]